MPPTASLPLPASRLRTAALAVTAAVLLAGCASPQESPDDAPSGSASASASASSSPDPEAATQAAAEQAVSEMTLEQKAGQVLVATWDGADPAAVEAQIAQIEELELGGVIIMGSNVPTATGEGTTEAHGAGGGARGVDPQAMTAQNERLAAALAGDQRSWPGIISVDQEGGPVTRLGSPLTQWPAAAVIGAAEDPEQTRSAAGSLGSELTRLGFTMDHAPVADVTTPQDVVIEERAYSDDPQAVAEQVAAAVRGFRDAGIVSSPKHFPGHGSVGTDSHVGLPLQERTPQQLAAADWKPFRAAVEAGAPSIMMGHIAVAAWDPKVPATLQPQAYQALRDDLGFEGVAVTDALNMGAVTEIVGPGRAVDTGVSTPAGAALQAGADLLLMPADEAAAHRDIVRSVESGAIPQERLDEAAARVVAMQMDYASRTEEAPVPPAEPGEHQDVAEGLVR